MKYIIAVLLVLGLVGCAGGNYVTQERFDSTTNQLRTDLVRVQQNSTAAAECRLLGDIALSNMLVCFSYGAASACATYEEAGELYDTECTGLE